MNQPADFNIERRPEGQTAVLTGDWTAVRMGWANERLEEALGGTRGIAVDATKLDRCDTSGAYGILKAIGRAAEIGPVHARPDVQQLLELVGDAIKAPPTPVMRRRSFYDLFDRIGRGVVGFGVEIYDLNIFNGHLLVAVGRAISRMVWRLFPWLFNAMRWSRPTPIRWAAVFSLAERAGLDAMPIVATTTFFIGAVVGLIGANMLTNFGAQVFAVDLIGISVLREFNIVITAVLLAGRSASAFAAEIGAMKMNQEIDAMQVLGVDPFDALVFPRFAALLFTMPLLTFVASLAGLMGGLMVAWTQLDISPIVFFQRLVDNVGVTHFWVGMSKAPVLAVVIAGIGCKQGMEVGGDVESLGRRVTSAVVQAIFATILIDAVFALIYMKLDV
jgi:phospholipid/cholesterol/gamma-HCH transport system permease protein